MTQENTQLAIQQFATDEQLMALRDKLISGLPQLAEQLEQIQTAAEESIAAALALEVSGDNLTTVKKARAELNKDFTFLEQRRKIVKNIVQQPYADFESAYKTCVTETYKSADQKLGERVKAFEDAEKAGKRNELLKYFDELCAAHGIDFVALDDVPGLNVTKSATLKSLCRLCDGYINGIMEALEAVSAMEHSTEILVEFKNHKNLSKAIADVTRRHEAIASEERRADDNAVAKAQRAAMIEKVKEAAQEEPEMLAPPVEDDPIRKVSFTVRHKISKLKELKQYLIDGGYEIV